MITGQHNVKADKDEFLKTIVIEAAYFNYLRKKFMLIEIMHKMLFYAIKIVSDLHLLLRLNLNSLQWSYYFLNLTYIQGKQFNALFLKIFLCVCVLMVFAHTS